MKNLNAKEFIKEKADEISSIVGNGLVSIPRSSRCWPIKHLETGSNRTL
jgi:hypothetical protein